MNPLRWCGRRAAALCKLICADTRHPHGVIADAKKPCLPQRDAPAQNPAPAPATVHHGSARVFNLYSAGDYVDIDDDSGVWTPVPNEDADATGALSIAQRYGQALSGIYTIEDGQRYALYWIGGETLVLRTPDGQRLPLFRRAGESGFACVVPGLHASRAPAAEPGYSDFRLLGADGVLLHACRYHALRYQHALGMNFITAADEDLADWDFFVALQEGIEDMLRQCVSGPMYAAADGKL